MQGNVSQSTLTRRILALASTSMAFGIISSSFHFYYVKVFLNLYKIEEGWFQLAQVLYLVWNAINDPLFAYIQDSTNYKFTRTRRESVLYSGPFLAVAFLIPWFPWGYTGGPAWVVGLHLIVTLYCWDLMFTYVGLAYCCLLTEISLDNNIRLRMIRYTQLGNLVGSSSVFILEFTSDNLKDFKAFQVTAVVLALCSFLLFTLTGKNAHTEYDIQRQDNESTSDLCQSKEEARSNIPFLHTICQIFTNRNFLAFVITNFFQEFHRALLNSFMSVIGDELLSEDYIPASYRKSFYGSLSIISQVLVILGVPVVCRFGYFWVIRFNFLWKMTGGLGLFLLGTRNPWILMLFLMLDSCLANGTYALFSMPLSDVADNDMVKHNRKNPVTSMIYGSNALVVKPAQSLSPMLIVAILNHYGYEALKKRKLAGAEFQRLHSVMFLLICFYPFVIGVIQYISWSFYTIHRSGWTKDIVIEVPKYST